MSTAPAADTGRMRGAPVPEPSPEQLDALLREFAEQPAGPRRTALRDHLIRLLLPVARRITRRFQRHGEEFDDLAQVAALGLIKAVDGYDPARGHAFLSYALPTVTGELRRHLRDRTAVVRLPRPLWEASGRVIQAVEELEQRLGGRSPTVEQIAEHTGLDRDRVRSALRAVHECRARSLDEPAGHDRTTPPARAAGAEDPALGRVVDSVSLAALVRQLPERDRRVLYLRFYRECSQPQIARAVGVSQMQVSRILRRCFDRLREGLEAGEPSAPGRAQSRQPAPAPRAPRTTAGVSRPAGAGGPARPAPRAAPPLTAAAPAPAGESPRRHPRGDPRSPARRQPPGIPHGPRARADGPRRTGAGGPIRAASRAAAPLTPTAGWSPRRHRSGGGSVPARAPRGPGRGGGGRPAGRRSAGPCGLLAPGSRWRPRAGPVPARCPRRTVRPPPARTRTRRNTFPAPVRPGRHGRGDASRRRSAP
ncbi:sigma-70 family RNA polymerase sigma factor [Streptomyces griseoflavus]|uniref:sigma-70 family RNA polymerase sigma factor n=1 Tax=Streptomyces griseoflavus TaxID=35619 RepID=UPI003D7542A8